MSTAPRPRPGRTPDQKLFDHRDDGIEITELSGPARASHPIARWMFVVLLAGLGAWLRLDQWVDQVLVDDEWHALHQILVYSPAQLFSRFGHSDYSIPFGMLYGWLASHGALDEAIMRAPMMLAGIVLLLLAPAYLLPRVGTPIALTHQYLLAISPLLIFYSRIARPYALTLVLGWVAHAACEQFFGRRSGGWLFAGAYVICSSLAVWAHPIAAPFVLAALLTGIQSIAACERNARTGASRRFAAVAMLTLCCVGALLGPALSNDAHSLLAKVGGDAPTAETAWGAMFAWYGTASTIVVVSIAIVSVFGVRSAWEKVAIARTGLLGILLTAVIIAVAKPPWVQYPEVLARYLLPAAPLLLLCAASGTIELIGLARRRGRAFARYALTALAVMPCVALAIATPLPSMLRHPNSYTLSIAQQFDYRPSHNLVALRLSQIAVSPFWYRFKDVEPESVRIAVGPYQFESYNWNGAEWERVSRQRVIPAWISGTCRPRRYGEMPAGSGFTPRNAVLVANLHAGPAAEADWLVWLRPFRAGSGAEAVGADVSECEAWLRERFGPPFYEDDVLVAFGPLTLSGAKHR